MSEIKGQLLSIVLVVAVFGAVAGVLFTAFKTSAQQVSTKITEDPAISTQGSNLGNLTFWLWRSLQLIWRLFLYC